MRQKNQAVARAWANGQGANGLNMSTDGMELYSYNLLIGHTTSSGEKVVRDYRSGGAWGFVSKTTSRHVTLAMVARA